MDLSSGGKGIRLKITIFWKYKLLFIEKCFDFNENQQSSMKESELKDEDYHGKIVSSDEIKNKICSFFREHPALW